MRQFASLNLLRDSRSLGSQWGRHVRLRSKALLADLIFYTAAITFLDHRSLPLVSQSTSLLRNCHLHTASVRIALSSSGRLRTLVPKIVGELWIILLFLLLRALRLHENLLVPLQTITLIRADCARLESLPGVLSISRIIAATELEHGVVLVLGAFLFELWEVHRSKVRTPILVKLLLA